jgi:putative addiction module component (TIGR02574 family)
MEYLSGKHFPAEWQGNLLVVNVIGVQGILRYKIEDKRANFTEIELELRRDVCRGRATRRWVILSAVALPRFFSEGDRTMSPGAEQILQSALALPPDEQWELVDAMIAALDQAEPPPLDEAWLAEIRRRSAELDAGTVTPIPWEEVRERARKGGIPRG